MSKDQPKSDGDNKGVFRNSLSRAFNGGVSGAVAMAVQVGSLMWLRTTVNYQYRHGGQSLAVMKKLYKEGGVARFYRGVAPALIQGPLSRFGDTAANTGVVHFLDNNESTRNLSVASKTMCASATAAAWRVIIMPVDTLKTTLQVSGSDGMRELRGKLRTSGSRVLYNGSLAAAAANFVGHYPWFFTFNFLSVKLPQFQLSSDYPEMNRLARTATIGFCCSLVSDTCSNSIRVVKTTKQTFSRPISYMEAIQTVVKTDGVAGLFGRGLKTKLVSNGIQGMMFTVVWKFVEKQMT